MLTDADDYRKPLKTAKPPKKGQVVGARLAGKGAGLSGPDTFWNVLPAGESREIAAGTLLHVKGPGKRLHSFWFDETGSVCGPMWFAAHQEAGPKRAKSRADRRRVFAACVIATLGMIGVVALVKEPIMVLGLFAPIELIVSLVVGWCLTLAWCFHCSRDQQRIKTKVVEVTPPRPGLVADRLPLPDQI